MFENIKNKKNLLGAELVNSGIITQDQLDEAIAYQRTHPELRLGEIVDTLNLCNKEELLKNMQKSLVHLTNDNNNVEYEVEKAKYQQLKKEFDEYPLYSNYLQAKERVNNLLIQVSEILSSL